MNITLFGPFRGVTGYDYLVRNVIQELVAQGHTLQTIEFDRWSNTRGTTDIDELLKQTCENNIAPEIHMNFCLLDQTRINPNITNIAYTMFESTGICPEWIQASSNLDKIIVPTQFNYDSFAKSGKDNFRISPDKLEVCPIPLNIGKILTEPTNSTLMGFDGLDFAKEFKHVFLNVSENIPRKNIEGLIRAWVQETKPEDNACLLLKLNSNFAFKLEFFGQKLKELIGNRKCAPIYFLADFLTENQMLGLYRTCTHYISCSFGEGWGISESICGVLGKRLVVPRSTSFSSYLDDKTAYLSMVQKVPAIQEGPTQRYYTNSEWFSPVTFSVRKMIRESIKDANNGDNSKPEAVANHLRTLCDSRRVVGQLIDICYNLRNTNRRSKYLTEAQLAVSNPAEKPSKPQEMNVGLFCKSIGTKCGIADYTDSLYSQFKTELNTPKHQGSMLVNGESCGYRNVLDMNTINVVNLQLEYQFISPENLARIANYCHNSNIALSVTLHTVNPSCTAYHDALIHYGVKVIVCSELMADCLTNRCGFHRSNVKVIPMGMSNVNLMKPIKIPGSKPRIGFFGFGYKHKGLDRLIRYMADNEDKTALVLSNKPENDRGYYDQVHNYSKQFDNIGWIPDHLKEVSIARSLSSCDVIFLPYSEYGGLATSAAIRTALKAGVPIAAFDTCFFRDVVYDNKLVHFIGNDPFNYNQWSSELSKFIDFVRGNDVYNESYLKKRDKFVADYSWNNVAAQHLDYFYEISK